MKRKIIEINEELCNGCGACLPNCPEGALQVIDGKVRLVSDRFCDGLGACVGECPLGAIKVVEREAEPYDERVVIKKIVTQGENTIKAHLKHLKDHNETELLDQAISYMKENNIQVPAFEEPKKQACGCPGGMSRIFNRKPVEEKSDNSAAVDAESRLEQWPVQLKLLHPDAPFLEGADLLVCADCVPFTLNNFHDRMLKGKTLAVFCPKLDSGLDEYVEKLTDIFTRKNIKGITVVRMEVPCCGGVEAMVREALERSGSDIPVKTIIVTLDGKIANQDI